MFCNIWRALPRAEGGKRQGRRCRSSRPRTPLSRRYRSLSGERLDLVPSPAGAPLVSRHKNVLLAGIWQPGLWRGGNLSAYRGRGGPRAVGRGDGELRPGSRTAGHGGMGAVDVPVGWHLGRLLSPSCPAQGQDPWTRTDGAAELPREPEREVASLSAQGARLGTVVGQPGVLAE